MKIKILIGLALVIMMMMSCKKSKDSFDTTAKGFMIDTALRTPASYQYVFILKVVTEQTWWNRYAYHSTRVTQTMTNNDGYFDIPTFETVNDKYTFYVISPDTIYAENYTNGTRIAQGIDNYSVLYK